MTEARRVGTVAKARALARRLRQRVGRPPPPLCKEWADILAKLAAPAAVLIATVMAQSYQSSQNASQMLAAREASDTKIRAEMFKAITDRLLGDKEPTPDRKAVFTELLAFNFHEHFELKPLMREVDEALRVEREELRRELARTTAPDQKARIGASINVVTERLLELQSVVARVRARQTAMLVKPPYQPYVVPDWVPDWLPLFRDAARSKAAEERYARGEVRMLSVRFSGPRWTEENLHPSPCDVPEDVLGQNACVNESMFENAPDGRGAISIFVKKPDPAHQRSDTFSVAIQQIPRMHELSEAEKAALAKVVLPTLPKPCGEANEDPEDSKVTVPTSLGKLVEFDVTRYDLPFTDNTPLTTGSRYALYIDRICPADPEKGFHEVVKFGLMWFPKDYFPPRERPTNYHELRQRLNVPVER
ncbi:MAG: hypothetical protein H6942_03940 [Candidatus Accumulibacter sp.]|uniref:hypothetical protein n=1 Tax=Accumulibacter sp. TaxID=2053492 RepID=UPI0019EFDCB5|nr:hypothetical protein [Accumulibacter sp.]MBE2258245.1 hypothetical protein [Paracoccaceae bacterium]MCP5247689.1 hypothetical protein [Accumulibacter sp.]